MSLAFLAGMILLYDSTLAIDSFARDIFLIMNVASIIVSVIISLALFFQILICLVSDTRRTVISGLCF